MVRCLVVLLLEGGAAAGARKGFLFVDQGKCVDLGEDEKVLNLR